jgi:hypothetical protein
MLIGFINWLSRFYCFVLGFISCSPDVIGLNVFNGCSSGFIGV